MRIVARTQMLIVAFVLMFMLTPTAAQAQAIDTYAVVIDRVTTNMGDGCGGPEFYAQFYVPWSTKWIKSTLEGGRDFYPPRLRAGSGGLTVSHGSPDDWGIWGYVGEGERDRIVIRLRESDDALCGGGDDHVDIARGTERDIYVWAARAQGAYYAYFEGAWHQCPRLDNITGNPYVCRFTSRGTGGESATVRFSVHFPGGW